MIWQDGETRDWPSVETRADEAARHGEIECPTCNGTGAVVEIGGGVVPASYLPKRASITCRLCEGHGYIQAREAHDCDETCVGCSACYQATGETICRHLCRHGGDDE